MCGLAGLFALDGRADAVDRRLLERMSGTLVHRGPDGGDAWVDDRKRVGLAHRRLSIIDLDTRADQPMHDVGGTLTVVFNGEIYNHTALRADLEQLGHRFQTDHSDTEVLLEGYRAWGLDGLLQRLSGMFAFALYDGERDTLMLVRDRIGIKPLYFTEHAGLLAFASEIKALAALPGFSRRLDRAAFGHYLTFLTVPAPATLFDRVAKLPAGHLIEVGRDRVPRPRRWWDAATAAHNRLENNFGKGHDRRTVIAEVRQLIEKSVAAHMVADVPVGVFLSGGVDSGAVLALATRSAGRALRTFTVGFSDDDAFNELEDARDAARRCGAEHHEVLISEKDAAASIDAIVHHQDEPLADWVCIPLWHVADLAHSTGTKAILVGEGADELFLGYQSYLRFLALGDKAAILRRYAPAAAGSVIDAAARLLPPERLGLLGLIDHTARCFGSREIFWSGAIAYWETQKRIVHRAPNDWQGGWAAYGLRSPGIDRNHSADVVSDMLAGTADLPSHTRLRIAELALRLPELLLMRVDKMTMAHSLEARVPFLDHELVEHALALDRDTLLKGGLAKSVLKEALEGVVPESVLHRPKRGFAAPMGRWLRGAFGAAMEARVLASGIVQEGGLSPSAIRRLFAAHRTGRRDFSLHLWPLINAALWFDHWIAGDAA